MYIWWERAMFQQHHECEREKDSLLPPSLSVGHLPTLPARALKPGLGPGWPFKSLFIKEDVPHR